MFDDDISPDHCVLVMLFDEIVNLLKELGIDPLNTLLPASCLTSAGSKFPRFVPANIEPIAIV